jgi:hypothetical protein
MHLDPAIFEVAGVSGGDGSVAGPGDAGNLGVELADRSPAVPSLGGDQGKRPRRSGVEGEYAVREVFLEHRLHGFRGRRTPSPTRKKRESIQDLTLSDRRRVEARCRK